MIYWLLQLRDLLVHNTLHVFLLFGLFCWLVWLIRLATSARYRPIKGKRPELAVSVLVPTFEEPLDILEANLAEILQHTSPRDEVLLLFDDRDTNRDRLTLSDPRLRVFVAPRGKRAALRVGIEQARNPVFLLTGSDTRLTADTIHEILKPFSDPSVGGVTGRVAVAKRPGVGARCYRWAVCLRNQMIYPGLSCSGTVHVLNGECYAARTSLAREFLDEFTNQMFLGKQFDSGDDGWMTTLLLQEGHRTVYQSTAVAETEPPSSFFEFLGQQLRWHRNSTRRTIYAIRQRWAWRRGALYPFHLVVTLLKTPLWIGIGALAIYYSVSGSGGEVVNSTQLLEPFWSDGRWVFFVLGIVIVRGIRGLPYLVTEPRAVAFLPIYAFLAPFVLAPLRMYGMLTPHSASWITRGGSSTRNAAFASVTLLVLFSAVLAMLWTFPTVAFALALVADDDFDAY